MTLIETLQVDHLQQIQARTTGAITPPLEHSSSQELTQKVLTNTLSSGLATLQVEAKTHIAKCRKRFRKKIWCAIKKANHLYRKATGLRSLTPQYQSEFFDQQHRYGKQLEPFFKIWRESTSTDDFNTWLKKLENGVDVPGKPALLLQQLVNADGTLISIPKVEYLSSHELAAYELQVDGDGKVFTSKHSSTTFHSKDHEKESGFGFVISSDKKIYVAPYKRGTFNHSSFLAGGPVLCAGILFCDNGKVTTLWDDSGHYNIGRYHIAGERISPSQQHMLTALNIFKDKGVDTSNLTLMINEINKGKWNIAKCAVSDFLTEMSQG